MKLDDNPNAVEQVQKYFRGVVKRRDENQAWPLRALTRQNTKRVVLCHNLSETKKEVPKTEKNLEIWTYKFEVPKNARGVLGFTVKNERGTTILSTHLAN